MEPLHWALLLLGIGLVLSVVEFFIPSGGVIGVSAFAALIASVVLAFGHGPWTGLGFLASAVLGTPLVMSIGLRYWAQTPIGRRLLLGAPRPEEVLPDTPLRQELKLLEGKRGVARSLMMPSGAVEVEGRTIDALSEGGAIEAGQVVRVVEVKGTRVVVRAVLDESPTPQSAGSNPLEQSIESLGLDPFNDPLA